MSFSKPPTNGIFSILACVIYLVASVNAESPAAVADQFGQLPLPIPGRPLWPVVDAISGNIGRISLPSAFDLETSSDSSWKYFAATFEAVDAVKVKGVPNTKQYFDLLLAIERQTTTAAPYSPSNPGQLGICMFKFGDPTLGQKYMTVNAGYGFSTTAGDPISTIVNPVATDYGSSLKVQNCNLLRVLPPPLSRGAINIGLDFTLPLITKGAPVGSVGAYYNLNAYDQSNNITISLLLQDQRGMVMEGSNGDVSTLVPSLIASGHGTGSLEYSNPRLNIVSGYVKSGSYNKVVEKGNLWLDHQRVIFDIFDPPSSGSPLYTGFWVALWLDDGDSLVVASIYPAGSPLLSGTEVGVIPSNNFGKIIHKLTNLEQGLISNSQTLLNSTKDFTLNNYNYPTATYRSPVSGKLYGTQFKLDVLKGDRVTYYLKYFQDDNEVYSTEPGQASNAFSEGGCYIYSDPAMSTEPIGKGFIEQMGRGAI